MEQRPSESQNESANELPASVAQPSLPVVRSAGENEPTENKPAETGRSEPVADDQTTAKPAADAAGEEGPVIDIRATVNQRSAEPKQQQQKPSNESGRDRSRQDRNSQERNSQDKSGQERAPRDGQPRQNQDGQERAPRDGQPRQNQDGQERAPRDGQPRQNQPNQAARQNQPGQERSGGDKQRDAGQSSRQQNNTPKQGQPNQSRQQNGQGADRPAQDRPSRHNQSPRDARPAREPEDDSFNEERLLDIRQPDRGPAGPRDETVRESDDRLMIGITLGDYNGIGPEVILKALQNNRLQKICTPVIYGSMRVLNRYRNLLELKEWTLNGIQDVEQASHKLTNVITCWPDQDQEIQPGKVTAEAGQAAFACLQRAVEDLREGKLDAIVTAPINKHNIQSEEFTFPGHTEYLAEAFSVVDNLMFMVSERLRVGVVTGHVPLGRVRQNITRERILQKLTMMSKSLKLDFGIDKPRIAVLGLNPHAGEEGLLGNEEQEILKPLIKQLQDKGNLVYGPFPADGFFGTRSYLKFDAVLAMYHDQGLIPFKAIAFEEGVNFTAAMPVVRTSPDHGTAYDIAGKNLADETSMVQAIYTACDVARRRRENAEIDAGALKPKRERATEKSSGL